MRVALVSPLFESVPPRFYGGTERVVANLCQGLTDANVEVTVFASGDSCTEGRLIPIIDQALRLRKPPVLDPFAYNVRMLSRVIDLAHEFDVIHNHHDYWMLPALKLGGVPVLTTCHGRLDLPDLAPVMSEFPGAPLVSISDAQRKPLPRLNWVRTIHHGLPLENFHFRETPGRYLAFLGRVCADKRPEWAIEIAKRSGIPLKIAAKIEGNEGRQYYDRFVKPKVDGRFIEFVGEISESEKSEFLSHALALVFPIDWPEPFGLVMIESLACGTPVLARPCGSVPEILSEGITGFSDLSIDVLARRARDIPALDRRRCRQWVAEKFSLQRMTEDYIHVYRELARNSAGRADRHRRDLVHPVERSAHRNS